MKVSNILICIGWFVLGMWMGTLNSRVVEVPVEIEKEIRVPYLNFTDPNLKDEVEVCANFLGLTLQNTQEVEKYFKQKEKEYLNKEKRRQEAVERQQKELDAQKYNAEKIQHKAWQEGYMKGYEEAMKNR